MSERVWDTRTPLDPAFERDWNARLSSTPQAHFAMRLDWLAWGARHGVHARAALVADGPREGVVVMRREGGDWVSGWPWRWQLMLSSPARDTLAGLEPDDIDWLVDRASRIAGGGRLRAHVPTLGREPGGFNRGSTLLRPLAVDEEALLAALGADKRRTVKKCEKAGWTVVEARTHDEFRAFHGLQLETELRRQGNTRRPSTLETDPAPGEGWREWELPWQWLLVAVHEDKLHAGSGFGRIDGGTLDYRTNASTLEGFKAGANVLLAWEALRRGRAAGMRWMNWGGATTFKRLMGGEWLAIECRLAGGARWSVPNRIETSLHRMRPKVARAVKAARAARGAGGATASSGSLQSWSTREALPPEFEKQWQARLARAPLANFSLRLDLLRHDADHDRHAIAVLAEGDGRRGALILRERGAELHSGWPWRWQVALETVDPKFEPGLGPGDAEWLFERAQRVAAGRRLRCFLPVGPTGTRAGFMAGTTIIQHLAQADGELFAAMDANKRRMLRRAERRGYEIEIADSTADRQVFDGVQKQGMGRRSALAGPPIADLGASPSYREWELPWMWLLVARFEGRVVAGLGDGLLPMGIVEGRTAAALDEARREGVMSLLCHHEARLLRDAGHQWLNHGGDTVFKREVSGTLGRRLAVWCWLGGGRGWSVPNRTEALVRRARPRLATWVRKLRANRTTKGNGA